jgi:glucose/arabinose dehydrogenase
MRHLILPCLILPCLAATVLAAGLPAAALAQVMKIPGETTTQSNIVKPAPLEATSERIAALGVPPGLKIEKFADGLKTPRFIVVGADGNLYVSSRDEGSISLLPIRERQSRARANRAQQTQRPWDGHQPGTVILCDDP